VTNVVKKKDATTFERGENGGSLGRLVMSPAGGPICF
jgi:hypothetical protein